MRDQEAIELFESSMATGVEREWLGAVFHVLLALPGWCDETCLDGEKRFTGGYIRRAALDKRILQVVRKAGGDYDPIYTYTSDGKTTTSHHAVFFWESSSSQTTMQISQWPQCPRRFILIA